MAVGEGNNNAVEQLINTASALGNNTIDLNRKNLKEFPIEVLDLKQLEFLYLEGNAISVIPEDLFHKLPNLRWLDLRNNRLTEIPCSIGRHRSLRNLLLEGNNIASLPLELGLIKGLSGLNLTGNPLDFPPSKIVERGTQEILKFLSEQFFIKQGNNHLLDQGGVPSASSSEESLGLGNDRDFRRMLIMEEEQVKEEESKRVRLPPIVQAASHPRNLTRSDESKGLLRGQKARQFEHARKVSVQGMELKPKSPKRLRQERQSSKQNTHESFEITDQKQELWWNEKRRSKGRERKFEEREEACEKYMDIDSLGRKRVEKFKIKRKLISPTRERQGGVASGNVEANIENKSENDAHKKPHYSTEVKDITSKTNEMRMEDNPPEVLFSKFGGLHADSDFRTLNLSEGDFVAIKVPEKLYIKGQPCLGKVTSLSDHLGLITVHYHTGSYNGFWRPMMSRTSPYLRKVPLMNVLCKFHMSTNGRMSPITAAKVKKIVDGASEN